MRVCEVILAPTLGGAETMALNLAQRLNSLGHHVDVVALDDAGGPDGRTIDGVTVLPRPTWARGNRLGRLAAIGCLLRSRQYDVVLAQTFLPNLYARYGAALTYPRVPVVATLQSAGDDFAAIKARTLEAMALPWTPAVIAVSPTLRDQYRSHFPRVASRVHYIPNAVAKRPLATEWHKPRPVNFAIVGRISAHKDIETALRGFAAFSSTTSEPVHLSVVGPDSEPEYANAMRRLSASLECDQISFVGPVTNPFETESIDVLVHTARAEGHALVILEAASRCIPIVCTRVPSISGSIGDHCTTFMQGDWRGLASALSELHSSWPSALAVAKHAYAFLPSLDDAVREYESVLSRLAHQRADP